MKPLKKTSSSFQVKEKILSVKASDWIDDYNAKFGYEQRAKQIKSTTRSTAILLTKEFKKALKRKKIIDNGYFETSYSIIAKNLLMDESTAKRHVKKLKESGFISEYDNKTKDRKKINIRLANWMVEEMRDYIQNPTSST